MPADTDFDVIIIGSGAGGGTLARHLAPSGKRILLLERGDWLPRELENWDADEVFVKNRYVLAGHLVRRARQGASSRGSTTASAARPSSTVPRSTGCAREDFGELRHHDGISPGLAHLLRRVRAVLHAGRAALPGARRARRGPDRAARERALPVPGGVPRAAHPAAVRRPRRGAGYHPFHAPCGVLLDEANMPFSPCIRCATCDGFPCLVHAKSDAEVLGRPAGPRAPERHPADERAWRSGCTTDAAGTAVTGVVVDHDGERRTFTADIVVVSAGAANSREAAAGVGQRPAPQRAGQRLGPGRPQLHVPQQRGRAGDLEGAEPDEVPEDARAQRLLLRHGRLRRTRWATSRWSASRRRRCTGARSRSRPSSRRCSRSTRSPSTRSTSGCRPRTCPRPDNRVTLATRRQHPAELHAEQPGAASSSSTTSSSRCSATWACTRTT